MIGRTVTHYRVLRQIGAGGMGGKRREEAQVSDTKVLGFVNDNEIKGRV